MNGIHDVGGMDGFELPERDQGPALKEEWERLVWGLTFSLRIPGLAPGGRMAIENIPPQLYLAMPYYARWLYVREQALLQSGLVTEEELRNPDGPIRMPSIPNFRPAAPDDIVPLLAGDSSALLTANVAASFAVGDAAIVKNEHPAWHTRVPRYVRGRRGLIEWDHGVYPFQDAIPGGPQSRPQHVYTVRFTARELWGSRGHANDRVYVDLWDDHLQKEN
jgi:nitrile hydratase